MELNLERESIDKIHERQCMNDCNAAEYGGTFGGKNRLVKTST